LLSGQVFNLGLILLDIHRYGTMMSGKDFSEHQDTVTSSALAPPPLTPVAPDQG
jgi:hypothetical protein